MFSALPLYPIPFLPRWFPRRFSTHWHAAGYLGECIPWVVSTRTAMKFSRYTDEGKRFPHYLTGHFRSNDRKNSNCSQKVHKFVFPLTYLQQPLAVKTAKLFPEKLSGDKKGYRKKPPLNAVLGVFLQPFFEIFLQEKLIS